MSISFEQAKTALTTGDYSTVKSLLNLVKDVSGTVESATIDTTYYLYTGQLGDGTWGSTMILKLKSAGGGVDVLDSQVGKFVDSREFKQALSKAIMLETIGSTDASFKAKGGSLAFFSQSNPKLNHATSSTH